MRRAGIAATALAALALLFPVAATVAGAFSHAEWYGQRSEGAAVEGSGALFRYVLSIWGGALVHSAELVAVVVPLALALGAPAAYAFRRRPFPGARARALDLAKMAAAADALKRAWVDEVRGGGR